MTQPAPRGDDEYRTMIELDPDERATYMQTLREEIKAALEEDRREQHKQIRAEILARTRVTNRRLAVLYGFLVAAFFLLAYRTETNADALRDQTLLACENRVVAAHAANALREDFIRVVIQTSPTTTPDRKEEVTRQLRDGLILPVENCAVVG